MNSNTLYSICRRMICLVLAIAIFISPEFSYAQNLQVAGLPEPGKMLGVSAPFTPVVLKGMVIHPEDPLKFDFLMDTGTNKASGEQLHQEAEKSIKYFLASLTVPDEQMWVNLSPYEKNRVIPEAFGKTVMGRDLLGEDYVLKQLASSLLYPENALGKEFWAKVYEIASRTLGTAIIDVNNFNRVWIVPSQAQVWEHGGKAVILSSHLKVMLDTDYEAMSNNGLPSELAFDTKATQGADHLPSTDEITRNLMRTIILPAIEKEVNEGANFARLRQIYAAMILSTWYKIRRKESLLGHVYAGKNKVSGVGFNNGLDKDAIYQQYLAAARQGVYNFIREEKDSVSGDTLPRKYFSGGFDRSMLTKLVTSGLLAGALTVLPLEFQDKVIHGAGHYVAVAAQIQVVAGSPQALDDVFRIKRLLSSKSLEEKEKGLEAVRHLGASGKVHIAPIVEMYRKLERPQQEAMTEVIGETLLAIGGQSAFNGYLVLMRENKGWTNYGFMKFVQQQDQRGDEIVPAVVSAMLNAGASEAARQMAFVVGMNMFDKTFDHLMSLVNVDELRSLVIFSLVNEMIDRVPQSPRAKQIYDFLRERAVNYLGHQSYFYRMIAVVIITNSPVKSLENETLLRDAYEREKDPDVKEMMGESLEQMLQRKQQNSLQVPMPSGAVLATIKRDEGVRRLMANVHVGYWRAPSTNPADAAPSGNVVDASQVDDRLGGIRMSSGMLDLQVKRDNAGVVLPAPDQDWDKVDVQGFTPVIINIIPVENPLVRTGDRGAFNGPRIPGD